MLVVKNPPANSGDVRATDSIPGSGRSPGGGDGNPLQYSCLQNPWTEEPGGLQSIGSQSWEQPKQLSRHAHSVYMSTLLSQESIHSICSWVSNFPFLIFSYTLKVLDLSSLVHFNFAFSLNNFGLSFTCLHALLCLLLLSSVSVFHVIAGHQLPPTSFLIACNALTSSSNS